MGTDESLDRLLKRVSRARQDARPAGPCLDAETVAAWTEGALSPHEREGAVAHAADCDRCLSVLAAIAQASPPPEVPKSVRWLPMQWLVPLTTAAIAVGVWVLVETPLESPNAPPQAPSSAAQASKAAVPVERFEGDPTAREKADDSRKRVASAPAPSSRRDEAQSKRAATSTLGDSANPTAKPEATLEKRTPVEEPAAPATPPPAATSPAAPRQAPAAGSPAPAESSRAELAADSFRSVARQVMPEPLVIVSSDPMMRWRASGSVVERSTDGGRTWRAQFTASGPLLAGASPTPQVCWLVGRSGLVLLSTDGETWRRLDGPDSTLDLVRVTARDAGSATVVAVNGRTFHTTDGGKSWIAQENPLTPF